MGAAPLDRRLFSVQGGQVVRDMGDDVISRETGNLDRAGKGSR